MCGVLRAPHHLRPLQRYATNTVSSYFVRCIRTYHLSHVACHTSHVTRHTSHITHHTTHFTRHPHTHSYHRAVAERHGLKVAFVLLRSASLVTRHVIFHTTQVQDFVIRQDGVCGSTIGPICATNLGAMVVVVVVLVVVMICN